MSRHHYYPLTTALLCLDSIVDNGFDTVFPTEKWYITINNSYELKLAFMDIRFQRFQAVYSNHGDSINAPTSELR